VAPPGLARDDVPGQELVVEESHPVGIGLADHPVRPAVLALGEPLEPPRLVGEVAHGCDVPGAAHRVPGLADEAGHQLVEPGEVRPARCGPFREQLLHQRGDLVDHLERCVGHAGDGVEDAGDAGLEGGGGWGHHCSWLRW
jgi:hypothetical protein